MAAFADSTHRTGFITSPTDTGMLTTAALTVTRHLAIGAVVGEPRAALPRCAVRVRPAPRAFRTLLRHQHDEGRLRRTRHPVVLAEIRPASGCPSRSSTLSPTPYPNLSLMARQPIDVEQDDRQPRGRTGRPCPLPSRAPRRTRARIERGEAVDHHGAAGRLEQRALGPRRQDVERRAADDLRDDRPGLGVTPMASLSASSSRSVRSVR